MRRFVVSLALLALQAPANGLKPLTPRLTAETRAELLAMLARAGFPEVGRNSVLIAIGGALGLEPRDNTYRYDEPHAHLPRVEAHAAPAGEGCAVVRLRAAYAPPAAEMRVRLDGTYCLVGAGEWRAKEQALVSEPAGGPSPGSVPHAPDAGR
jgi:hypothetical protein